MSRLFVVHGRTQNQENTFLIHGLTFISLLIPFVLFFTTVLFSLIYYEFTTWEPMYKSYTISAIHFLALIGFYNFSFFQSKQKKIINVLFVLSNVWFILAQWSVFNAFSSLFILLLLTNIAISTLLISSNAAFAIAVFTTLSFNLSHFFNLYSADGSKLLFFINHISFFAVAYFSEKLLLTYSGLSQDVKDKSRKIRSLSDFNNILLDNISSSIIVTDASGEIKYQNNKATFEFANHLDSMSIFQWLPYEKFKLEQSKNQNSNTVNFELRKDNESIWDISVSVFRGYDDWKGFIFLIKNITDITLLRDRIKQKEKLAAVGQLAAGIAHEIRNPLASMSGSVQLLKSMGEGHREPEEIKLLSIVQKEAERLNALITEFLDYVRPAERYSELICVNDVVNSTLDFIKLNNSLNFGVEQIVELNAKGLIYGDGNKLRQAFMNIIINAYHAMEKQSLKKLKVSSFDEDEYVVLIISDSGIGIETNKIDKIFEPFHTTKHNGTGLGLAVTHKIIESHEGEVIVKSELEKGTEFILRFPLVNDPKPQKQQAI